ncbi:hypothetical protein DM558_03915 [Entomomonas moraniae]|uniref:Uncharacterized protein n=1 Tax=Entomomonas moraniae TaxID=2213226 RepID=A0A3Q9JHY6_9GAMM|nr:hypothetical protein [Entomomonas moraniae]AZS49973.1 hypothetical protein DM558_03915 [Entomomonas moraniae]
MKAIPTHQKRALAELHIRIEELRPDYNAVCEFGRYTFQSNIFNENDITVLGVSIGDVDIEIGGEAYRVDAYQKKLAVLVDQLACEAA